jgi:curved DNA-binding protein CbpA
MNIEKDYYAILGVLPSAEIVVIKAAYKALIKVYHPDRSTDSHNASHAKTVELNEAYEVLSDVSKRKEYDNLRKPSDNDFSQDNKSQPDFSKAFDVLEQDWQVAVKYEPELNVIIKNLSKLSSKLVFLYKVTMIESKQFDKKALIAEKMEQDFLSLYFGSNNELQAFAKELLLANERNAAKELNKAITVLGNGANAGQIIKQIEDEFCMESSVSSTNKANADLHGFRAIIFVVFLIVFIMIVSAF